MLLQEAFDVGSSVGEKSIVHKCERRGRSFDVEQYGADRLRRRHEDQDRILAVDGGTCDDGRYDDPRQTGS